MATGDLILGAFAIAGCVVLPVIIFVLAFVRMLDNRYECFGDE